MAPKARRPWSPRRGLAAVCALLGAVGCATVLYDVVSVRLGGTPAPWRHALLDRVYGLSRTAVSVGVIAVVLVLAGIGLVWLALTPGARTLAPMVPPSADVRASLDRSAVVLLLRDTSLEVPGVGAVRVRVRRRKVRIRATVRFGDQAEIREALIRAATGKCDRLGLARPLTLRVRVRPDDDWVPPANEPSANEPPTDMPVEHIAQQGHGREQGQEQGREPGQRAGEAAAPVRTEK
ncbi:DUF6286 domain-containing protein [Streptomyces sp. 8L]|nr:DUF6286 domain-containing protein [Streptomyces sp. 8L]